MFRNLAALVLLVSLAGCAALSSSIKPGTSEVRPKVATPLQKASPSTAKKISAGLVFGKIVFEGLLKAAYVRLTIVSRNDLTKKYFFIVGDKANQSVVPWAEGKVIEPGYFYWELPVGAYEVRALAIPVGSTIAEEPVAWDFEIARDRVNYLGTLDVNGTREKAKFGGVPVVRPGFEYELALDDDFEAAKKDFEARLPKHAAVVFKGLLQVKSASRVDAQRKD